MNHVSVGRCIYCGTTKMPLSKEHCVPFALNGRWTLNKASCHKCADITSRFEMDVLRYVYCSSRASLGLQTRRKHPELFPIQIEKNGIITTELIPIQKLGGLMTLFEYKLPAFLDSRPYEKGIDIVASTLVRFKGDDIKKLAKELGTSTLRFSATYTGNNFERFIAKIAYCMAIYQFGIDAFESVYVLPSILGQKDDIGKWLGSLPTTTGEADIYISFDVVEKNLMAKLRLFGKSPVPTYIVVVGKFNKEMPKSHHHISA